MKSNLLFCRSKAVGDTKSRFRVSTKVSEIEVDHGAVEDPQRRFYCAWL